MKITNLEPLKIRGFNIETGELEFELEANFTPMDTQELVAIINKEQTE